MTLTQSVLKSLLGEAVASANIGSKIWCGQTYTDVFTGETLINTLVANSANFASRNSAVECAQRLLDTKVITCITKRRTFDDSDRLYCINRKELENAVAEDLTSVARTDPKGKTDNSPNSKAAQVKEPLGKLNSQEKMNGKTSPQQSHHVTPKTNGESTGVRSTSLQKLLEKDALQKFGRQSSLSANTTTASTAKSNFGGGLKDKPSESPKEKKLTANKFDVVLSQQESERRTPNGSSVILLEETSLSSLGRDSANIGGKIKPAVSPKTPAKSERDSKRTEDKQKVKSSLSPSLTALIERDAKNTQNFQQGESKKVEVNGTSSPKANEDGPSKSEELSKDWEAFELKLQNKVKKSAEKPGRVSLDARGSPDTRGSNLDNVKTRQILIEDSTEKERGKIVRTFSAESRDSKDGKAVSSEVIDTAGMPSKAVSRKPSKDSEGRAGKATNEDTQVKLSVNGDKMTVPSVRARKNSFLSEESSDSDGGKHTNGRERGSSCNLSDETKTVIIEDTIEEPSATKTDDKISGNRERVSSFRLSDAQNTVIIENGIEPHNLLVKEKSVSRNGSQCSTNSREDGRKRVSNLSREASLDNTESKPRASSLGESNQESRQIKKQNSIENGAEIDKGTNSKEEGAVTINSRAMPKILADLLARDGSEGQSRAILEQGSTDNQNFYKDKLKELKKTTPIYTGAPIKLNDRGKSSANQGKATTASPANQEKACTVSSDLQNGPDTVKTEMTVSNRTDYNEVQAKEISPGLASNTKVFNSNSAESSSSNTSRFAAADEKQERLSSGKVMHIPSGSTTAPTTNQDKARNDRPSPTYVIPRLNLHSQTELKPDQLSPNTVVRPGSLNIALSPLLDEESSTSEMRLELQRRSAEFAAHQRLYETKITELQLQIDYLRRQKSGQLYEIDSLASISDVTSLYSPYSTPMVSPGNSTVASPSPTPATTPRQSIVEEVLSPKSPPPPPPPVPPSIPAPPLVPERHVKLTKPVVTPKTEMKPLFWNRIINSDESPAKAKCVWQSIKEPPIDTNEFERLFSKKINERTLKRRKSLRDDKHFAHINGKKVAKLLETNRSRAIGIKMSSLNCQLEDIRNAVYNMDTSVVDMESLQSIYDIYPKDEEVQMIEEHLNKVPSVPLDKPEEFMNQLTKMKHFKERLECWLFQDKFSEIICGIERSLACVTESSNVVTTNSEIATLLGLVLAYGNYMNGNTQRGQADGFHLEVLLKLRDVKTRDSEMNLLQYTVKQYLKQYERCLDKNKNESRLPSPVSLSNAAQVSFDKLKEELVRMSLLLDETEMQVKKILDECSPAQRNPFENKMRAFQETAKQKISDEKEKMEKAEVSFLEAVEYFRLKSEGKKETPQEFFGLWAKFIDDVKTCIKLEKQQQQIAKKNFSKVEHLNQIREAATKFRKRRQSVDMII